MRARVDAEFSAGWVVTVASSEDYVLGFVAIRPHDAVLAELFVRPDLIGGGIGRTLLTHAMVAMPGGFTLYTASSNARARRFYEKSGFNFLRDDAHPRTGHPVTYYGWTPR